MVKCFVTSTFWGQVLMKLKTVREEVLSKLSLVSKIYKFPDSINLRSMDLLRLAWYWKLSFYNGYIKIIFH